MVHVEMLKKYQQQTEQLMMIMNLAWRGPFNYFSVESACFSLGFL